MYMVWTQAKHGSPLIGFTHSSWNSNTAFPLYTCNNMLNHDAYDAILATIGGQ